MFKNDALHVYLQHEHISHRKKKNYALHNSITYIAKKKKTEHKES